MSLRPPGGSSSYDHRDDLTPEERRYDTVLAVALAGFVLVVLASFAATRDQRDGTSFLSSRFGRITSGQTSSSSTTTTTTEPPSTTTVVPAIDVQAGLGDAIIAGHISCKNEGDLHDDAIETVEAAVAADNATTVYAGDPQAQSEIVQASVQQLHSERRFYANCAPVPGTSTASTGSSTATDGALPPSR